MSKELSEIEQRPILRQLLDVLDCPEHDRAVAVPARPPLDLTRRERLFIGFDLDDTGNTGPANQEIRHVFFTDRFDREPARLERLDDRPFGSVAPRRIAS
jgi:hypothetical protein